jgi:uncharacterized protein with NAD-binding domain and iron-sulfur cluster
LTPAHELADRGFDVTVYERRAWGGKALSTQAAGSAAGGRLPLPGEHGFRIFPGFYQNNPDSFRRIPCGSNRDGVFGNFTDVPQLSFAREGRRQLIIPVDLSQPRAYTPALIWQTLVGAALQLHIPGDAAAYFADRAVVYLSSCDARRIGQWDNTAWTTFIRSDRWPGDYTDILATSFTHILLASRAEQTSAQCVGAVVEWMLYNLLGLNSNGSVDRILNLPTNEALIDPWVDHLRALGVHLRLGHAVHALKMQDGRIAEARVRGRHGSGTVTADWYVCALPVERARRLWTRRILAADPTLAGMFELKTDWMNGIQLYLRRSPPLAHGHIACVNSPWKVSGILQAQFWARDFASSYGDGRALDCFSAIVSDWHTPGVLYGKRAQACTSDEIVREVWQQLKSHVNDVGLAITDDLLLSSNIDPGLVRGPNGLRNEDPLVLPSIGARKHRPASSTGVANLMLARRLSTRPLGSWQHGGRQLERSDGRERGAATVRLKRAARTRLRALPAARVGATEAHRRRTLQARARESVRHLRPRPPAGRRSRTPAAARAGPQPSLNSISDCVRAAWAMCRPCARGCAVVQPRKPARRRRHGGAARADPHASRGFERERRSGTARLPHRQRLPRCSERRGLDLCRSAARVGRRIKRFADAAR